MIPGFTEAVNMKNKQLKDQEEYEVAQKAKYRMRIPFLEPDVKSLLPVRFEASNRKPLIKKQEGGPIEKADNTRVQKPIYGSIDPSSKVRTYDNIPVRVPKNYPNNDTYLLEAPARKYNSPFGVEMNVKYPWIYGVEVTGLGPEYILKIEGNDTTYFTRGEDDKFYRIAALGIRPKFREAFKNPEKEINPPNYFNTPEKIERLKNVISNWNK